MTADRIDLSPAHYRTTAEERAGMRSILRSVIADPDPEARYPGIGLCGHLREACPCAHEFVAWYAQDWPEYSGVVGFPVPHPDSSPENAYLYGDAMYDGEYGASRLRLARFLLDVLDELDAE